VAVETMPFPTEADAVQFCIERLRPFASKIAQEPDLGGCRPDLGFRLRAIPDVPLALEVKRFDRPNQIRTLSGAIFQANTYAQRLQTAAFVAPFFARGSWDFHEDTRVAGAMLVAGQASVGALAFHPTDSSVMTLVIAGQTIATLGFDGWGDPFTILHSKARTFLTYKHREGSQTWRARAS
jgi:hypothetical protein